MHYNLTEEFENRWAKSRATLCPRTTGGMYLSMWANPVSGFEKCQFIYNKRRILTTKRNIFAQCGRYLTDVVNDI